MGMMGRKSRPASDGCSNQGGWVKVKNKQIPGSDLKRSCAGRVLHVQHLSPRYRYQEPWLDQQSQASLLSMDDYKKETAWLLLLLTRHVTCRSPWQLSSRSILHR